MMLRLFFPLVTILVSMLFALRASAGPFIDVPVDPWDGGPFGVDHMQSEGFIEGFPDGYFLGTQSSTRYETVVVLARMLDRLVAEISVLNPTIGDVMSAQATAPSEMSFVDVPSDHWAYEAVQTLENIGVLIGHPGAKFDGNRPVTRSKLAAMLSRLWQLLPSPFGKNAPSVEQTETPSFTDLPEDNWAYPDVAFLARIGFLEGYPDGTFRGQRTLTRFEMVKAMERWWDRFEAKFY